MTSRSISLLPVQASPRIERIARLSARSADTLDAILVIIPMDATPAVFSALPHAQIWRQLFAGRVRAGRPAPGVKAGSGPGSVRSVNLTNSRQTRLILGTVPRNASAFETLSLAGRMARDLGGATPGAVALSAPGDPGGVRDRALEALLSATLACAFEMPSFRSHRKPATALQRIAVVGGALDLRSIQIAAEANGLARWLTALPPNKLDATGYQRVLRELARRHGLKYPLAVGSRPEARGGRGIPGRFAGQCTTHRRHRPLELSAAAASRPGSMSPWWARACCLTPVAPISRRIVACSTCTPT